MSETEIAEVRRENGGGRFGIALVTAAVMSENIALRYCGSFMFGRQAAMTVYTLSKWLVLSPIYRGFIFLCYGMYRGLC